MTQDELSADVSPVARHSPYAQAAFDELGRTALREHSMESLLQRVAELTRDVVPGAREVSVSVLDPRRATTVVSTGQLASDLDESQYAKGYGPCLAAAAGGETMYIDDARTERRWGDYARTCVQRGSLSSMSVPVPLTQSVSAALNVYGEEAHAFDAAARDVGAAFAAYAGVALSNMHLYDSARQLADHLERAMQSRAVIDQAKGILMGQRRCTAEQAFDLLVSASQRSNRKLRDVAQSLVDSTGATPPSGLAPDRSRGVRPPARG